MHGAESECGCERCGQRVEVSFTHWQFLCRSCRADLEHERVFEARKGRLLAASALQDPGPSALRAP